MYTVTSTEESSEFPTREKAVERARTLSRETRGRVTVTGSEDPVRMVYAGGSIIEFEKRTGGRR